MHRSERQADHEQQHNARNLGRRAGMAASFVQPCHSTSGGSLKVGGRTQEEMTEQKEQTVGVIYVTLILLLYVAVTIDE